MTAEMLNMSFCRRAKLNLTGFIIHFCAELLHCYFLAPIINLSSPETEFVQFSILSISWQGMKINLQVKNCDK